MKWLLLIIIFCLSALFTRSQDIDSSDIAIRKMVDSARADLKNIQSIEDLPGNGKYYIARIVFMDGTTKKITFYGADSSKIFFYADTFEKELDTIPAADIDYISFREKNRAGKIISRAAAAGFLVGGVVGYFSKCEDCSEGLDLEGAVRGLWWGIITATAAAAGGAIISIFNNGERSIEGNPERFRKLYPWFRKFSISNQNRKRRN